MRTIRWRLEKMSCVLVLRNKYWFQHAIKILNDLWQTVVKERNNPQGYEHRAPKRRQQTSPNMNASGSQFMQDWLKNTNPETLTERKCLIDMSSLEMD